MYLVGGKSLLGMIGMNGEKAKVGIREQAGTIYIGYEFDGEWNGTIGCIKESIIGGVYNIYNKDMKKIGTSHGVREGIAVLAILSGFTLDEIPEVN